MNNLAPLTIYYYYLSHTLHHQTPILTLLVKQPSLIQDTLVTLAPQYNELLAIYRIVVVSPHHHCSAGEEVNVRTACPWDRHDGPLWFGDWDEGSQDLFLGFEVEGCDDW